MPSTTRTVFRSRSTLLAPGPPARSAGPIPGVLLFLAVLAAALLATPAARASDTSGDTLERVQALLDEERPEEALALLDPLPDERTARARALLHRSTARFMLGRLEEGKADLDRTLELDPELRQAWLNRAGLEIAEGRYDSALAALEKARELDPEAADSHLNMGAVHLLQGKIGEATEHFERYLARAEDRAEAHYLVAKNYAGRGYARLAVENLRRAVAGDERYRLLARTDPTFEPVASSPDLKEVLETDTFTPPASHHRATQTFDAPYEGGDGVMLPAVLESLRRIAEPFDPRVEVAAEWAVIHGDRIRVKVEEGTDETVVRLSAPPDAFGTAAWSERAERLFREIRITLVRRQRPTQEQPPDGDSSS